MSEGERTEIVVAGAGPVGLAAALALASNGRRVTLLGPKPAMDERRTAALMLPSLELLERLGVADALLKNAAPLSTMRIIDATNRLIRSPSVTFRAAEIGEDAFGYNVPNRVLNAVLSDKVEAHPGIEWKQVLAHSWQIGVDQVQARLVGGGTIAASICVAADGRNSAARDAAGIGVRSRMLPQTALVCNFGHKRHHGFASTEFHTEHGPCTQVPLPGGYRSSLVWVMEPSRAEEFATLDDIQLADKLEEQMHSMLGRTEIEDGRALFPLSSTLPKRFASGRVALVGEAAHVFPPITAQGLNLGLRDVADLATCIGEAGDQLGEEQLSAYARKRLPDIFARSGAVSLVNGSLLATNLPAQLARSVGLTLLDRLPGLRGFFMREGMRPGSGLKTLLPQLPFGRVREKDQSADSRS
ncbi:UbiH/UbiF family hydroxylase [Nitratireductor basaltis]|uniref:2-octaprenyl-3-methyl-6-methoxy-1,4-benzoquinol hydroxylase n=1 Tax=Nitratireductor basaltis TaxID=472175 RepID=A0A084UAN4_9HYPH|nr:UbiH/UbiF family hydroxylase [Nitratireductor basaltis]KFB10020.1 2-octaprenyl-3-methyl-6-methoxy-1,4-benzoquinol hydroxylase precursor [Nitratireductor basaltis]